MNTRTFKTYIEVDVEVTYSFTKGRKGTRDKFGVPEAPDDDDEIELTSVLVGGIEVTHVLPKLLLDSLEEEAWEDVADDGDE